MRKVVEIVETGTVHAGWLCFDSTGAYYEWINHKRHYLSSDFDSQLEFELDAFGVGNAWEEPEDE